MFRNGNKKDELFKAIRLKDNELLNKLLEDKQVHPDARHERDLTPAIVTAVKYKNFYALTTLLKNGANANAVDINRLTAVLYASDLGKLSYLKALKKCGADFNIFDDKGATPLMLSAQWGHEGCLQFLLNEMPNVNAKDKKGETALMYASKEGKTTCVQRLVDVHADVNAVCHNGYSALMHALKKSEFESAELLLYKGAEVNIVGRDGKTALSLAFLNCLGDFTLVESILKRGAQPSLSKLDQEHLHEMIARGEHAIVRLMIINGCAPMDRQCKEMCFKFNCHSIPISPLCVAMLSGHDDIARYLLIINFLTNYDILHLSRDHNLRIELQEKGHYCSSSLDVLDHLPLDRPFSLYTLCFVKLCNILNSGDSMSNSMREDILYRWRLPKGIQTELLFQGPFSRICAGVWKKISLDRDQAVEPCTCRECETTAGHLKEFKVVTEHCDRAVVSLTSVPKVPCSNPGEGFDFFLGLDGVPESNQL